jgi:uncharacterized repeat protein (TIGR03803 family)
MKTLFGFSNYKINSVINYQIDYLLYKKINFIKFKITILLISLLIGWQTKISGQSTNSLYGVTNDGGIDNKGVLFHIDRTNGSQVVDYSFQYNKGKHPTDNLTDGGNGKFYGTTSDGGFGDVGVIFEWDPVSNTYTKKIDFDNTNGSRPRGTLILYNGKLYGVTQFGGENSVGVIFEYDPSANIYTKKIDFEVTTKGRSPSCSLTLSGGKFYGTTLDGGANDLGVIYEWDPSNNTFTKKIDFDNYFDTGGNPSFSLTQFGGKFYGVAGGGANNKGVIFEWDLISNTYIKKLDIDDSRGYVSLGSFIIYGGKLYGMALGVHDYGWHGGIFEWNPITNIYTKKFDFDDENGCSPAGYLTLNDGKFYGMTYLGGTNNMGVLFEWDPLTNIYTKKIDFAGASNGKNPEGPLTLSSGKFYGMTYFGGVNDNGVIFEWDPNNNVFNKKRDFDAVSGGGYPNGSLTYNDGKFYGMSLIGGIKNHGVIFEWNPATNVCTKKTDFDYTNYLNFNDGTTSANGGNPTGSLTIYKGKFYGTTPIGGNNQKGILFEWDQSTNTYNKMIDFELITNGGNPCGFLTPSNGKLYGMTSAGGVNGYGVIFEWDPMTNVFTKKIDFDGLNGSNPYGSLTLYEKKLYGMTSGGGSNSKGVIFEWDPVNNIYSKKKEFDNGWGVGTSGNVPYGNLSISGGKFYGMTYLGGTNNMGVLFEWDPASNIYTNKLNLGGVLKGGFPEGSLTNISGKLYGMTHDGGANNMGVIFEWDPANNSFTKLLDFNGINGSHPIYTQLAGYMAQTGPYSNAGADQSVNTGVPVTLDGSASFDPDGDPITYKWTAPSGIFLSSTSSARPTFTSPFVSVETDYIFTLVVNNGSDNSSADEVKITVKNSLPVGLTDLSTLDLFIYPNPNEGIVNISSGNVLDSKISISVYDVNGNEVYTRQFEPATSYRIDLSGKPNGVYIIQITYKGQKIVNKLVLK